MARIVYTDASNRECSAHLGPDQPVVSIGRATDCTIRSNRKSVSRHHAEFRYNNGTFEVIDLNSSNGTWLIENEQRFEIAHERLEDQDEIWCGDFIIHFLLDDAVDNEFASSRGLAGSVAGLSPTEIGVEYADTTIFPHTLEPTRPDALQFNENGEGNVEIARSVYDQLLSEVAA